MSADWFITKMKDCAFIFWPNDLMQTKSLAEAFSEPCQTSKMEHFAKIVNGLLLLQNAPH